MRVRSAAALLLVVATLSLPGCVVSLFSETGTRLDTEGRIDELEQRMDRAEQAMEPRPPS